MSALVIDLRPVRNAVEQSQRMGMPEDRKTVVQRVLADIRAGHHAFNTARALQAQRLRLVQGGAA